MLGRVATGRNWWCWREPDLGLPDDLTEVVPVDAIDEMYGWRCGVRGDRGLSGRSEPRRIWRLVLFSTDVFGLGSDGLRSSPR